MNTKRIQSCLTLFAILFAVVFCFSLFAQTNEVLKYTNSITGTNAAPTPAVSAQDSMTQLVIVLIPVLVPLIVAAFKFFLPKMPGWILPILAPALGELIDLFSSMTGHGVGPVMAAVLGSAGVGLREIVDQVNQARKGTNSGTAASLAALLMLGLVVAGCNATLQQGGDYAPGTTSYSTNATSGAISTNFTATVAPDFAFYQADAAFDLAYNTIDAVFQFERDNRAFLWQVSPDIKHALDKVRPQAVLVRNQYIAARAAYMANPVPANLTTLQAILAKIQQLIPTVQAAIPPGVTTNISTNSTAK